MSTSTDTTAALVWQMATLDALSPQALYALLQMRSDVFVVEQNCVFLDMDGQDAQALHLMAWRGDTLVACARCFAPGVQFQEASIGRIATRLNVRGDGLGHLLVQKAIALVISRWGSQPIRIGAQARLKHFYQGHGFDDMGMPYVEDGIDHLEMVWHP